MTNDFFFIFNWWVLLFSLGIIFLPLTWFFFRDFFDLGYSFSKIMAILFLSYFVWMAGSLKILPFSVFTIWLVIFFLALANFLLVKKYQKEFFRQIKNNWKILIFEEILFFFLLAFWSFIRGFQPDIEGLEKFMDFGFVNSILRSQYFPPADIWMAGKNINYYYFGHLATAVLTKISDINSAITYNLMIATIFALSFTATFSLGGTLISVFSKKSSAKNLKKIVLGGFLSAALLSLGGNIHTLWWFLTHDFSFQDYWYPDATRFIVEKFGAADNTIHEFPIYSFVVSDLHGHVSDIPFVLLFLALAFTILLWKKPSLYFYIFISLVLGILYMTNSWDFPIYFLVLGAVILWWHYQKHGFTLKTFYQTFIFSFFIFIFSILFSLPFHLNFSQIAQGINFVHARSPFWQLLVLWGYQWIIGLSLVIFLFFKKRTSIPDIYILILLLIATFLIITPEIIYVKDIYIASYHRANTMFKLVYQSFMLYSISAGYITIRLWPELKIRLLKSLFYTLYFLLFVFVFIYPYFAVKSYYNLKEYRGIYGLNFLKKTAPNDFAAILWLEKNIKGQPVVLEAVGDSYTTLNRVSMATGLPTIQGWLVHEWLWRGGFDEPGRRAAEVETIFESKDPTSTKNILEKYQVQYVFIGSKEQEKYQVFEDKFKTLGKIVFSQGNTKIYLLE